MVRSKKERPRSKAAAVSPAPRVVTLPQVIDLGREEVLTMSNLGLEKQLLDQNYQIQSSNIQQAFGATLAPILQRSGVTLEQWARDYELVPDQGIARRRAQPLPGLPGGTLPEAAVQHMN